MKLQYIEKRIKKQTRLGFLGLMGIVFLVYVSVVYGIWVFLSLICAILTITIIIERLKI